MRFGISATSLMCPKNLRTRLRPVNVCCAIVASHFVAPGERTLRSAIATASGLNFDPFRRPEDHFRFQVLNLFFRLSKRKTTRGALERTRPFEPIHHGPQKPEIACLPTAYEEKRDRSHRPPR